MAVKSAMVKETYLLMAGFSYLLGHEPSKCLAHGRNTIQKSFVIEEIVTNNEKSLPNESYSFGRLLKIDYLVAPSVIP